MKEVKIPVVHSTIHSPVFTWNEVTQSYDRSFADVDTIYPQTDLSSEAVSWHIDGEFYIYQIEDAE